MLKKLFVFVFAVLLLPSTGLCVEGQECFTIVVGKDASEDGAVLLGHNEDNGVFNPAGFVRVERKRHGDGQWFILKNGARIKQEKTSWAYWRLQMPGLAYSDAVLNEFGVAVVSNNCPSQEDKPEFFEGGIGGPELRVLAAERAKTARQAIELMGALVEKYGYAAKGRTMVAADPNEAWVMGLVQGKHWGALRVPDDEVAVIANTYSLRELPLNNQKICLACKDLKEYAAKRGWWDSKEGAFEFERAYASRSARKNPGNTHRQWSATMLLAAQEVNTPEEGPLPFSFKPKTKLKPSDLAAALRNHYENAPFWHKPGWEGNSPHKGHTGTICNPNTNSSSIFQLRSKMPLPIGALWWSAFWSPCCSVYLPIYFGLEEVPPSMALAYENDAPVFCPSYRAFSDLAKWVEKDYRARIPKVSARWRLMESMFFGYQESLEKELLKLWEKAPDQALELMGCYCNGAALKAKMSAERFVSKN